MYNRITNRRHATILMQLYYIFTLCELFGPNFKDYYYKPNVLKSSHKIKICQNSTVVNNTI